jgi:hypothetical protein
MDDAKRNMNPEFDSWRLLASERMGGAFMTRTILTPEIRENIKITMGLIDDSTKKDPPEQFPGSCGYLWQDWDFTKANKGKYWLYLEYYGIPGYKKGDEVAYCNYMDHPIRIRGNNQERINQPMFLPELGQRYKEPFKKKKS